MADSKNVLPRLKKIASQPWYCDTQALFNDAIALIESMTATPGPCPYCKTPPVVLDEIATGDIHIGCRYAYFRAETAETKCKSPLSVIGMKDRKSAVERWNQECKMRADLA